jgi:hypothetical protein
MRWLDQTVIRKSQNVEAGFLSLGGDSGEGGRKINYQFNER